MKDRVKELNHKIEQARTDANYHKKMADKKEKEWFKLWQEREKECSHKYEDGSSAWRHHYAYSDCSICGYSDL
jgi:hypothetical protein